MKRAILLILSIFAVSACAQNSHIELRSSLLHLRIMNDTIPPSITVNPFRAIEPGYPFVQRDSAISVSGCVTDLDGVYSLQLNGKTVPLDRGGKFATLVQLGLGRNIIRLHALDKKRNPRDTSLIVYRDPTADTTAPTIDIREPFKMRGIRMLRKTPTLRVAGIVSDEHPVAALFVNGHRVDSLVNGAFAYELPTDSLRGIYVKAVDSSGNVAVDSIILPPHAFSLEAEENAIPVSGRFFALLIGVQKYRTPGIEDLGNPVHDAENIETLLSTQYTFDKENITVLKNPTRDKILESFENMYKVIREDDNFLVFYAGHGFLDIDAHQGYWWPSDAQRSNPSHWISNADIRDQIKRVKARHTLLISDACFSGSVFRTTRGVELDNADIPTVEAYKKKSRTALTSGEADVPDKSVFTKYLIEILKENQYRQLRTVSLFGALHDAVMSNSPDREGVEYGIIQEADDTGGGDFVFFKRAGHSAKEPN